jgi:hypothetical protein
MSKVFRAPPEYEDSSVVLRCRIEKFDETGNAAVQSDISAILLTIFDLANPRNKIAERTLTVNQVVFSTLQLPASWKVDGIGYNVKTTLLATDLPQGDRTIRADMKITFTGGAVQHASWDIPTLDLKRS